MSLTIGFILNPIAGLGGKKGWKGTDNVDKAWDVYQKEEKYSSKRIEQALDSIPKSFPLKILYCDTPMGKSIITEYPFESKQIYSPGVDKTTANHTKEACKVFLDKNIDLLVFVGGDGTANDIYSIIKQDKPVLGIPSGVKMFSGCFLYRPSDFGSILQAIHNEEIEYETEEIMDVDEEKFRDNRVETRLTGHMKVPMKTGLIQGGKVPSAHSSESDYGSISKELEESKKILEGFVILGPGSTVYHVMKKLGIEKTLLGVDIMENGKLIKKDVDEHTLHNYSKNRVAKIVLTPIGGQGFLLGRGNQQISARVLKSLKDIELDIIATESKSQITKTLVIDLEEEIKFPQIKNGYIKIITSYRQYKLKKVNQRNN